MADQPVCLLTWPNVRVEIAGRDPATGQGIIGVRITGKAADLADILPAVEIVAAMLEPAYAAHPRRREVRPLIATQRGGMTIICGLTLMAGPVTPDDVLIVIGPARQPLC
jgi:hypothetical protein